MYYPPRAFSLTRAYPALSRGIEVHDGKAKTNEVRGRETWVK
jgi:hypothetical protein